MNADDYAENLQIIDISTQTVDNMAGKFRDNFGALDPTKWDLVLGTGDAAEIDGNAGGSRFLKITKSPVLADTETVLLSKATFTAPARVGIGLTMSQRIGGQEVTVEYVAVDSTGKVIEMAGKPSSSDIPFSNLVSPITCSSSVNTINTTTPHGLRVGDRIVFWGFNDSRLNAGAVIVASVPSTTQFTYASTLTNGSYAFTSGNIRRADPFNWAQDAFGYLFDGTSPSNGIFGTRVDGNSALMSPSTSFGTNFTNANTPSTPVNYNTAGSYCFNPAFILETTVQLEAINFNSFLIDSPTITSLGQKRSQGIPDQDTLYKIRIRVRNLPNATIPAANIVSAVKTGTTTATITTDAPHGLTTSDFILIYGTRDSTNFPNIVSGVGVASVINSTQFTVVWGTAVTQTMYGGTIWKANALFAPPSFTSPCSNISRNATGGLTLVWTTAPSIQPGETFYITGAYDTAGNAIAGLGGRWRAVWTSSSIFTAYFEPLDGQTGSVLNNLNANFCVTKATDVRLHLVRYLDYTRHMVEVVGAKGHGDLSQALPVDIRSMNTSLSGGSNTIGNVGIVGTTTSNALTAHKLTAAATTNATLIKASAGRIMGGFLHNLSAAAKFVKFYNKASAPTVGTDVPVITVPLNAGEKVLLSALWGELGLYGSTGLAYAITGAIADSDTTAVAAGDVQVGILYA